MVTDIFLNQKRVNVCEHTTKMASLESFGKVHQGLRGMDGGKFKRKLSEVTARAVSRGQNELVGKFKMTVGDIIRIRVRLWSTRTFQQESKGSR